MWNALLQNSEFCGNALRKLLVERLPSALEITSENMEHVKEVVESYMLLIPDLFFCDFYEKLVAWAAEEIPKTKEEGVAIMIKLLDMSVQVFNAEAVGKLIPVLVVIIEEIHQDGNRMFALKVGLFARCLFTNFAGCLPVFSAIAARKNGITPIQVFHEFLKLWTDQISWISKLERTKLCGLALMNMLVVNPE